jgi:hypothetical protein
MTFEEMLDAVLAMLQRRGRVTYRALKRQFHLDDDALISRTNSCTPTHRWSRTTAVAWSGPEKPIRPRHQALPRP